VGNKSDLEAQRKVSEAQGKEKCDSNEKITKFFECSTYNNTNVDAIFKEAVKQVYEIYDKYKTGNILKKSWKFWRL